MRFLFVDEAQVSTEGVITLTREQSHRVRKVLRLSPGDELLVRLKHSGQGLATVVERGGTRGSAVLRRVSGNVPVASLPTSVLNLGVALLKKRNLELVVQKATELAVTHVTPLLTERAVVRDLTQTERRRLVDIAEEACQQSGRPLPPEVADPLSPRDFACDERAQGRTVLLLSEGACEEALSLHEATLLASNPLAVLIGPEGGWSPHELEACRSAGAEVRHLPGYILRAETAAITIAALIAALRGMPATPS